MKYAAYLYWQNGYGPEKFTKMDLTGRWRIEWDEYGRYKLYLERRVDWFGLFSVKRFESEDNILILPDPREAIIG